MGQEKLNRKKMELQQHKQLAELYERNGMENAADHHAAKINELEADIARLEGDLTDV